ncbi:hypothetical protein Phi14:2_gp007 [Cellulophaga phage phi14:2]|uniref:Uncharacterized protein n=1 Tax=Cellulophaga phage phi14:2 TaxID=1327990 RepID=S0A255_9CAUD|nr:hypothetical protein Phi14:2_gp007 [Cellulophaga phage phi14:2]
MRNYLLRTHLCCKELHSPSLILHFLKVTTHLGSLHLN